MLYAKSWWNQPVTFRGALQNQVISFGAQLTEVKSINLSKMRLQPNFQKASDKLHREALQRVMSVYQSWPGCCKRMLLQWILTCRFMFGGMIRCFPGRSPFFSPCGIPELCRCSMWWRETINCIWHLNQNSWQEYLHSSPRCCHWFVGTLILTLDTFSLHAWTLESLELKQVVLAGVFLDTVFSSQSTTPQLNQVRNKVKDPLFYRTGRCGGVNLVQTSS